MSYNEERWVNRQLERIMVIVGRVLSWLGLLAALYVAARIITSGMEV